MTGREHISAEAARSAAWDARWERAGSKPSSAWLRVGSLAVALPLVLGSMSFLGGARGSGRGIVLIALLGGLMLLAAADAVWPSLPRRRTRGRRAFGRLRALGALGARFLSRGRAVRCVYCHDDLLRQPTSTCGGCGAVYHLDCRADGLGGACATLECPEARPARAASKAQPPPSAQPPSIAAR